MPGNKKPIVFLICTGLGNINRGYESFSGECFAALKDNNEFDLFLLKGGGEKNNKERVILNCKRKGHMAMLLSKIFRKDPYFIEQFSFFICLLPLLIIKKPGVIYYSDFILGTFLWHIRKRLKLEYRLLFSNGAPNGAPFKTEDHVQQLLPLYYNDAIRKGEPVGKQTLLPYGFNINIRERINAINNKQEIRAQKGIEINKKIILSIGAVNTYQKRMDYIIRETALLDEGYYLIILGQFENETEELLQLAKKKLPGRHFIANLPFKEVSDFYIAADYFVLASLSEGFGRVVIEAMSFGLPCIVHDYMVMHQVLKENGLFINMQLEGALASCLSQQKNMTAADRAYLINAAYNLYSWDKLKEKYSDMINKAIHSDKLIYQFP